MSADKRKKLNRAYRLLREANCGDYPHHNLSAKDVKNPTIRFIVRRGLAKLKRVSVGGYCRITLLDTGVRWVKRPRSSPFLWRSEARRIR